MPQKKFWSLAFLFLVFAAPAQADSLTLAIKAWGYSTSGATDSSSLTMVAMDSSGKEIALAAVFPDFTFVGVPNSTYATTATGVVSLSSISAIAVSPRGPLNSIFNLAASQALPSIVSSTVNVSIGFTGSLKIYAGDIFSPTDPRQPLTTMLSFTLAPGTGTYTVSLTGTKTLTLAGTGGTLTIDQPLTAVPEPASLLLLGSGLAALAYCTRRFKR